MQVKSIAESSKGSILQYFRPSLSYHLSLRSSILSIFEWPLYRESTVIIFYRERDGLMEQVAVLKTRLQEMVHREDEAYQQMKKGIELVEQAQLEQTQV